MPKLVTKSGKVIRETDDYSPEAVAKFERARNEYNRKNPRDPVEIVMRGQSGSEGILPTRRYHTQTISRTAKRGGLVSRGWGKARKPERGGLA